MPRMIIITSILVSIIALSLLSILYTGDVKSTLSAISNEAILNCREENINLLRSNAKKLSGLWESRQHILSLFIRHDELSRIDSLLVDLNSYAESGTFYEANVQLNQLIFTLDHLYSKETPSLDNLL